MNLAHYRVSADHKHALFLTAQPTPWVTGAKEGDSEDLKIGSSTAWVFEAEGAKVGMLEFSGAGVEAMRLDLRDMQQQMSVLGARLLEVPPTHQEAASAVRMRHAGDDAVLQKIAGRLVAGCRRCFGSTPGGLARASTTRRSPYLLAGSSSRCGWVRRNCRRSCLQAGQMSKRVAAWRQMSSTRSAPTFYRQLHCISHGVFGLSRHFMTAWL